MLRFCTLTVFVLTSVVAFSQTNYKQTDEMSFNLLVGCQSFPAQGDIDAKLQANNFTRLNNSPLSFGLEFSAIGKKAVWKSQFHGTSLFKSKKVQEMTSQTASISLQFGYDILPRAGMTFLYPFGGLRYFNWLIFGKSTTGVKLSADRSLLDFLAGFGLRQFLNDDLHGVFNNLDINFGTSLSLANGKWQAVDDTDASFIQGKMKNRMTYFVTVTIGRAFRVAN